MHHVYSYYVSYMCVHDLDVVSSWLEKPWKPLQAGVQEASSPTWLPTFSAKEQHILLELLWRLELRIVSLRVTQSPWEGNSFWSTLKRPYHVFFAIFCFSSTVMMIYVKHGQISKTLTFNVCRNAPCKVKCPTSTCAERFICYSFFYLADELTSI